MSYIGLLDCNNFFVSCERLFRPDLHNKPVAVLSSNDGVIVARSNEVKRMGIPMGIPLFQAKSLCDISSVTLFSSNFTLYRDISTRVMETLISEVGKCEIYSIDEAFFSIPDTVAREEVQVLRSKVMQNVGIPVSIGVSRTKTLAKEASEIGKKGDGVCILTDVLWQTLASGVDCSSIWGLGRARVATLRAHDVTTAGQFMALDRSFVRAQFGVGGERIYDELKGVSVHALGENSESIRQSITSSRSFAKVTQSLSDIESAVGYHITQAGEKLREKRLVSSRIHIEMRAGRHSDFAFRKGSVEVVLTEPTDSTHTLLTETLKHVRRLFDAEVPYKKVGITLSSLMPKTYLVSSLFDTTDSASKTSTLDAVTDSINQRYGHGTLRHGVVQSSGARSSATLRSKDYTTRWGDIPTVRTK